MPKIKITKTAIERAASQKQPYELRDTSVSGFLCRVSATGRKTFMVDYRTAGGERRKPAIGLFGQLTVEQARAIAQDWLAEARAGGDPSLTRHQLRENPTVKELAAEFIERHSIPNNKPSTVRGYRSIIRSQIVPKLGKRKVDEVTRVEISELMRDLVRTPTAANHTLSCLRKMFNCAELWGYRRDGTNPCRLIPKYPGSKRTRLIKSPELAKLFAYMDRADAEGLEHPFYTLAIRLQFAFAARMSEILCLRWEWIDFEERRVVWPDSKTGGMSKPLSEEAYALLLNAPRLSGSPFVIPGTTNPQRYMGKHCYWHAWKRILAASGIAHVGTHGIRHRAATDIANSGIPLKVGMTLTAHKTVTMFMRYVHVEDDQVRAAAEVVSARRAAIIGKTSSRLSATPSIAAAHLKAGGAAPPSPAPVTTTQRKLAANDR